jgi:hypothetical protein
VKDPLEEILGRFEPLLLIVNPLLIGPDIIALTV